MAKDIDRRKREQWVQIGPYSTKLVRQWADQLDHPTWHAYSKPGKLLYIVTHDPNCTRSSSWRFTVYGARGGTSLGNARTMRRALEVAMGVDLRESVGHLEFAGGFEFYEQGGEVYRAPIGNAFDLEGRRHGRWEGSLQHFRRNRAYIYPPPSKR